MKPAHTALAPAPALPRSAGAGTLSHIRQLANCLAGVAADAAMAPVLAGLERDAAAFRAQLEAVISSNRSS